MLVVADRAWPSIQVLVPASPLVCASVWQLFLKLDVDGVTQESTTLKTVITIWLVGECA